MSRDLIFKCLIAFLFGIFVFSMTRGDGLTTSTECRAAQYYADSKCRGPNKKSEDCMFCADNNFDMMNSCTIDERLNWCDRIEADSKCKTAIEEKYCPPPYLNSLSECIKCINASAGGLTESRSCSSDMLEDACELYFYPQV